MPLLILLALGAVVFFRAKQVQAQSQVQGQQGSISNSPFPFRTRIVPLLGDNTANRPAPWQSIFTLHNPKEKSPLAKDHFSGVPGTVAVSGQAIGAGGGGTGASNPVGTGISRTGGTRTSLLS